LLHAKQAQRGGRSIALSIIISVTRRGLVVSAMPQLLYLQEAGWALGPVLMGVENQQHVGQPKLQHNVKKIHTLKI